MRKFIAMLAIIIVAFATTNCTKDSTDPITGTADVSFNVNSVTQSGLKSTATDTIICTTLSSDYVKYKLDNGNFKAISVFYVGGIPWTNSIKLPIGPHTINEFMVYSDNNTPNDSTDDVLLSAVPHAGSGFAGYVTTPLNQSFVVETDKKLEVKLDVVCFQPQYYTKFGFVYFQLNELTVRQMWFFGDFCVKDKSLYAGSSYALRSGWSGFGYGDVPAIIKVEVWRGTTPTNKTLQNTFTNNDAAHNYGDKVSVTYGDYKQSTDYFEVKFFILVRQGTTFDYVQFNSYTFTDISNITTGSDGVIDFVLGNCYDPSTPPDYIYAPWMNLPLSNQVPSVTYYMSPATLGGYVNATLGNISTGFDISNGTFASYCGDHNVTINYGVSYNMDVYSSLYPEKLPLFAQSASGKWAKINWLFNHLDWFPTATMNNIEDVIWSYDNVSPIPTPSGLSTTMRNACDQYGVNYHVPTGGWACIIFIPHGTPANAPTAAIQTMFIKIDP